MDAMSVHLVVDSCTPSHLRCGHQLQGLDVGLFGVDCLLRWFGTLSHGCAVAQRLLEPVVYCNQHHICCRRSLTCQTSRGFVTLPTAQALQRTAGAVLPLDRVVAAEQPQPPPAVTTSQGEQPQVTPAPATTALVLRSQRV